MSCYSHSERGAAFVARQTFSLRVVLNRVADYLRRTRDRRRQRQERKPGDHGAYPGIKTNRMKGMSAMPTITPLTQKPSRSLRQLSVIASTIAVGVGQLEP